MDKSLMETESAGGVCYLKRVLSDFSAACGSFPPEADLVTANVRRLRARHLLGRAFALRSRGPNCDGRFGPYF